MIGYTISDLKALMREIEDFGDAWRRERAEQTHLLTAAHSHCPVLIAPEPAPAVMLQTNAHEVTIAHLAEAFLRMKAGQAPMVLGVVGAPAAVKSFPEVYARPGPPTGYPSGACYLYWVSGTCRRGKDCKFKHEAHPAGWLDYRGANSAGGGAAAGVAAGGARAKSDAACLDYSAGKCRRGD